MGSPANFIAGGNILPASFVKIDPAKAMPTVVAASGATDKIIGIAQEAADQAPIPQVTGTQYAATSDSKSQASADSEQSDSKAIVRADDGPGSVSGSSAPTLSACATGSTEAALATGSCATEAGA